MKRNKGFTLVELLAVIVVLAIILMIAVPIVQRVMRNAQENQFKNYAQNMLRQGKARWQLDQMAGTVGVPGTCYTMEQLDINVTGNYHGVVRVSFAAGQDAIFRVSLTDGNRTIHYQTANQIDAQSFEELHHRVGGEMRVLDASAPEVNC